MRIINVVYETSKGFETVANIYVDIFTPNHFDKIRLGVCLARSTVNPMLHS